MSELKSPFNALPGDFREFIERFADDLFHMSIQVAQTHPSVSTSLRLGGRELEGWLEDLGRERLS